MPLLKDEHFKLGHYPKIADRTERERCGFTGHILYYHTHEFAVDAKAHF